MSEPEPRVSWTTRINIRPSVKDALRRAAKDEGRSLASMIGVGLEVALTDWITAGSSA